LVPFPFWNDCGTKALSVFNIGDTIDTLTCGGLALSAPFRATRCNSDMRMDEYIADLEKLRSCKRKGPCQAPGPSRFTSEEDGKRIRRYWTTACQNCSLKSQCTTGPERRIPRWEHEHLLEAVQQRLDANPEAMRQRRETVEHPFGTMKARMGATHFLTKTLPKVAAEMALSVLAYNLTRVMNIVGIKPLIAAIAA
jgi:hypothetical protein